MGIPRWTKLGPGTPLGTLIEKVNEFGRSIDRQLDGGDRGAEALTSSQTGTARLQTGVESTADVAGATAGVLGKVAAAAFFESFDGLPGDASYEVISGVRSGALVTTGETGGRALRQTGAVVDAFRFDVPFDRTRLYRVRAKAKLQSGAATVSFGLRCYDAAGALLGQLAVAASGSAVAGTYTEFTGWVRGTGAAGALPASDPTTPTPLPTGTVAVRPYYAVLGTGAVDLDCLVFDILDEDTNVRVKKSLLETTDPRYAGGARLKADVIDEPALRDDSVSTRVIQTDVVITGQVVSIETPSIYLDLRTGKAANDLVFSHPAFTLTYGGNATFSGTVAAQTFTAATANFGDNVRIGGSVSTTTPTLTFRYNDFVGGTARTLGTIVCDSTTNDMTIASTSGRVLLNGTAVRVEPATTFAAAVTFLSTTSFSGTVTAGGFSTTGTFGGVGSAHTGATATFTGLVTCAGLSSSANIATSGTGAISSATTVTATTTMTATGYRVGVNQVVGARLSAIAAPTGGTTIDANARTTIGSILTALRTHGLIAT